MVKVSALSVNVAAAVGLAVRMKLDHTAVVVALHRVLGGQPDNFVGREHYAESYPDGSGLNDDSLISELYSCEVDLTCA